MSATGSLGVFVAILVILDGCRGVPRPCPQFLPVAVRLDQQPTSYSLKNVVKLQDEIENAISKNPESNFVVSPSDLLLPEVKEASTKKPDEPKFLQISELSTATPETNSQKPKKRRRVKPKESHKIILSTNSNWALKTINDAPAVEVLMTDKASIARDLQDSTESALVSVKKLEDQEK